MYASLISVIFICSIFIINIMISTLIFIIYYIMVKIMEPVLSARSDMRSPKFKLLAGVDTKLFLLAVICVISASTVHTIYAQTSTHTAESITLSDDLLNDPVAQDILKKIEITKKMIEDLEQKEYEQNQAKENLEKMRNVSIEQLNQDLDEWERMWEKHSSRNSFERFANTKPSYVQGIFWDQFDFKEQKVKAGRIAMNQVLTSGGTMQDAKSAYAGAASTSKIELIEMNAQFNVNHNLADYEEQQVFNSTGQLHLSSANKVKLATLYADYKLQPSYILANSNDKDISSSISEANGEIQCEDGFIPVSRMATKNSACVDEFTAKKWIADGVKGIKVLGDDTFGNILPSSKVQINPGTNCGDGNQVIYVIESSEYLCVQESVATKMIENETGENHTLTSYVLKKDEQKITDDQVYEINQAILRINAEHDEKKKNLEMKYGDMLENEKSAAKLEIQEIVKKYKSDKSFAKEDVDQQISKIKSSLESEEKRILGEKLSDFHSLDLELKNMILKTIKGHENNPDVHVNWDYLNDISDAVPLAPNENKSAPPAKVVSLMKGGIHEIILDNVGVVNSFGHEFDEIKTDQVLQVAADITNANVDKQDFVYVVEIADNTGELVQPAKWVTGTLNPSQTFNVGLSWMPEEIGEFNATLSIGDGMDSLSQVADIKISVNPEKDISDENYCKTGFDLLFKYVDNSPICATPDTASKLINIGLAFA